MSGRASSGPPLSDSDNRLGRDGGGSGREREKGCVSVGGGTAGSCFPFTSALLYLSAVFPAPEDRKERIFFLLLCHYQEIIICCSVFHTDNFRTSLHMGSSKTGRTNNTFVYSMPLGQMLPLGCS